MTPQTQTLLPEEDAITPLELSEKDALPTVNIQEGQKNIDVPAPSYEVEELALPEHLARRPEYHRGTVEEQLPEMRKAEEYLSRAREARHESQQELENYIATSATTSFINAVPAAAYRKLFGVLKDIVPFVLAQLPNDPTIADRISFSWEKIKTPIEMAYVDYLALVNKLEWSERYLQQIRKGEYHASQSEDERAA